MRSCEVLGLASCHFEKNRYVFTGWGGASSLARDPPHPLWPPVSKKTMQNGCKRAHPRSCFQKRSAKVRIPVYLGVYTHTHKVCTNLKSIWLWQRLSVEYEWHERNTVGAQATMNQAKPCYMEMHVEAVNQ